MTPRTADIAAMRRAIVLSAEGIDSTSPNPSVGCVVLGRTGTVVGEGFHRRKGESHAEVNALTAAGELARGGTAAVTLEPCNHYGRTPPCRKALIDAGVVRVVIGILDPTSREEGGASALRDAGIDVEVGLLADEVMLVLEPWHTALRLTRPHVTWVHHEAPLDEVAEAAEQGRSSTMDATVSAGGIQLQPHLLHGMDVSVEDAADQILRVLHERGARRVVLRGNADFAARFLRSGQVDSVISYLPRDDRPARLSTTVWAPIPADFRITALDRVGAFVRVVASRSA